MELFTISFPSDCEQSQDILMSMLVKQTNRALHKDFYAGSQTLVQFELSDNARIRCLAKLPDFQLKAHGDAVFKAAAEAMSEYIVAELEEGMLEAIIKRNYSCSEADLAVIQEYCHSIMYGKEWEGLGLRFVEADQKRRIAKIAEELEQYLSCCTELNLKGYTTFRLQAYRKELTEVVQYAYDEFTMEKQYQEFISLVRYFVCLQETKIDKVHLLHKGGHEFTMYNDRLQEIESKPQTDRIVAEMLESEMNMEDMVISSLISISPKEITIHTKQPEMSVIRTIESIFDDRVTVCLQCSMCKLSLEELIRK